MRPRKNINKLLDRLSESEERFLTRKFLAPAVRGRKVGVAIDGVRLDLETHPKNFEGWGVFRPESHNTSRFVRDATLLEQRRYLDMLPMVRMILCTPEKNFWRAVPADSGTKLTIVGAPPIASSRTQNGSKQFEHDSTAHRFGSMVSNETAIRHWLGHSVLSWKRTLRQSMSTTAV